MPLSYTHTHTCSGVIVETHGTAPELLVPDAAAPHVHTYTHTHTHTHTHACMNMISVHMALPAPDDAPRMHTHVRAYGWMDGWIDGWMDGCMHEFMHA